ncbi:MAG TPA: UDP-N-acetylmuramoyl-tripeptide--D-alanyl-D-alanine ligase, partial [Coxiellaceae bacterium]|nr:UDP-N-acetylmuramoyl-tripeptide--D-alanyl-D-alanine ligase [Coxiellaceae bacterium]
MYKACLKVIADITGGTLHGSGDLVCEGIATDSRESCEGSLFAALTGPQF